MPNPESVTLCSSHSCLGAVTGPDTTYPPIPRRLQYQQGIHVTEHVHVLTIYQTLAESKAREIGAKKEMADNLLGTRFVTNRHPVYNKILSNSNEKKKECEQGILD